MNAEIEIQLRVVLIDPPVDVTFAVQRGKSDLHEPVKSDGKFVQFDFSVRAKTNATSDTVNCLGPFAQGPPATRFVYINSGTLGGDRASCWTRRAKVPLTTITRAHLDELDSHPGSVLEAQISGISRDGGPACASVPLLGDGWRVVSDTTD